MEFVQGDVTYMFHAGYLRLQINGGSLSLFCRNPSATIDAFLYGGFIKTYRGADLVVSQIDGNDVLTFIAEGERFVVVMKSRHELIEAMRRSVTLR